MGMPADGHVHSEWSWDAPAGSMAGSCARAVELGLPAIAFTEHLDHTAWTVPADMAAALAADGDPLASALSADGVVTPPAFDAAGYLGSIAHCRERFPGLRILAGVEVGEPHRHADAVAGVLRAGRFDRVLGSVHCLPDGDGFAEPPGLFRHRGAPDVMRAYLAEVERLVTGDGPFSVLAHIDYPVRYWPRDTAGPFDPSVFEEEFRAALRATARSGRVSAPGTGGPADFPGAWARTR